MEKSLERIQRKRTKNWRMPPNTICVGRPTKWGIPFKIGQRNPFGTITADKRHAWQLFLRFAPQNKKLIDAARNELRGRNLACWRRLDEPCHADLLMKIANGET